MSDPMTSQSARFYQLQPCTRADCHFQPSPFRPSALTSYVKPCQLCKPVPAINSHGQPSTAMLFMSSQSTSPVWPSMDSLSDPSLTCEQGLCSHHQPGPDQGQLSQAKFPQIYLLNFASHGQSWTALSSLAQPCPANRSVQLWPA